MRITLELDTSLNSDKEMAAHIATFFHGGSTATVGAPAKDPYEEPVKLAKPRGKKVDDAKPAKEPGPAPAPTPAPEPAPTKVEAPVFTPAVASPLPTEKELTDLIAKVQKTIGLQKFRDALTALGVKRVSELPKDKMVLFYNERMADIAKFEAGEGSLI